MLKDGFLRFCDDPELACCRAEAELGKLRVENIRLIARVAELERDQKIDGNTSDGYHTFNELYHHRAVLFSVVCAASSDRAWKSKFHHDGTMFNGMFIVGIQTPYGQATYHYDINPYWDMFRVKELDNAPEWDGHTPAQAIERIGLYGAELERELQGAVRLPCKVGMTITDRFAMDWEITEIDMYMYGKWLIRCGHKGTEDYCAFWDDEQGDNWFLSHDDGVAAYKQFRIKYGLDSGANTRAEAEKATKGTE